MKKAVQYTPAELINIDRATWGWTQRDLADEIGVDYATMSRLTGGKQAVTPEMAKRLGAVTGRDPKEYFDAQCALWWEQGMGHGAKHKQRKRQ